MVLRDAKNVGENEANEFQYISCYGSTEDDRFLPVLYELFQYISCYGSTHVFTSF